MVLFFWFCALESIFFLTSMSVENHANMAASYPSSTSPPHHSHFPSTFPHAHPYLTHVPSLLQWAEIHPAPPASSSAASTPRTASSPPYSLSLSLSLSLSMVLLILLSLASLFSFLTLVHA